MMVVVVGQRADEPVRQRKVTPREFFEAWGPYASWLWDNARAQTAYVGEYKMRVVVAR